MFSTSIELHGVPSVGVLAHIQQNTTIRMIQQMSIDVEIRYFLTLAYLFRLLQNIIYIHYQQHLSSVGRISHVQIFRTIIVRCLLFSFP